jgi:pantetheine-phosphate adenylyltransferase
MSKAVRIGVYPGTFDPITNGHTDIIVRATRQLDRLLVAVALHTGKEPLFDHAERIALARAEVAALKRQLACPVSVIGFDTLLVDLVRAEGARCIVRGLRAVSDFEFEFQMAAMNARLAPEVETVFLMASERQQFISARFVKEIARLGGDVSSFVSPRVLKRLKARLAP